MNDNEHVPTENETKRVIRGILANFYDFNVRGYAENYHLSPTLVKQWVDEVRIERVKPITKESLQSDLWGLDQRANEYLDSLMYAHQDIKHIVNQHPQAVVNLIKTEWQIDKERYHLKQNAFSSVLNIENPASIMVALNVSIQQIMLCGVRNKKMVAETLSALVVSKTKMQAAGLLGIDKSTLYKRLKAYPIINETASYVLEQSRGVLQQSMAQFDKRV
jgi:hypothetical protein